MQTSNIKGLLIQELEKFTDQRGWLAEFFRQDELGKDKLPQMGYISMTEAGRSRGPHEHRYQTDIFVFLGSSGFNLYLWDNRPESESFKQKEIIEIQDRKLIRVIIPHGIVHGYKNVGSQPGLIINAPNKLYRGESKLDEVDEVRYEQNSESQFKIE